MLAFLPLTLLGYFLLGRLPEKIQLNKVFLVLASFLFYGYNNPSYVPINAGSITIYDENGNAVEYWNHPL